jgi:hypothetical protein
MLVNQTARNKVWNFSDLLSRCLAVCRGWLNTRNPCFNAVGTGRILVSTSNLLLATSCASQISLSRWWSGLTVGRADYVHNGEQAESSIPTSIPTSLISVRGRATKLPSD